MQKNSCHVALLVKPKTFKNVKKKAIKNKANNFKYFKKRRCFITLK